MQPLKPTAVHTQTPEYVRGWNAALNKLDKIMSDLYICSNDYERPVHEVVEELKIKESQGDATGQVPV